MERVKPLTSLNGDERFLGQREGNEKGREIKRKKGWRWLRGKKEMEKRKALCCGERRLACPDDLTTSAFGKNELSRKGRPAWIEDFEIRTEMIKETKNERY